MADMPDEIWYSQSKVNNGGKEYTIHFASLQPTAENKTRYVIAEGFEKYLADRVDARLADLATPPTQVEKVRELLVLLDDFFNKPAGFDCDKFKNHNEYWDEFSKSLDEREKLIREKLKEALNLLEKE